MKKKTTGGSVGTHGPNAFPCTRWIVDAMDCGCHGCIVVAMDAGSGSSGKIACMKIACIVLTRVVKLPVRKLPVSY